MSGFILPLAEGESRPARSAAAGDQFGDFLCKAETRGCLVNDRRLSLVELQFLDIPWKIEWLI